MIKDIRYRCSVCDYAGHVVTKNHWNHKCEGCGESVRTFKTIFKIHRNPKRTNYVDVLMDDNPRKSDSMGINPDQIPAFQKRWPWMRFDTDGRCNVANRAEKKRVMKARGYDEF